MKPPIFVIAAGDIVAFDSVEATKSYVEPIDIQNEEYIFYDSEGRLLSAVCIGKGVKLSPVECEPKHAPHLEAALRELLSTVGKRMEVAEFHDQPSAVAAFQRVGKQANATSPNSGVLMRDTVFLTIVGVVLVAALSVVIRDFVSASTFEEKTRNLFSCIIGFIMLLTLIHRFISHLRGKPPEE